MKNLRCRIHQSEPITNYCASQQCFQELCATCISQHTNMHVMKGTLPNYENIQETLAKAQQIIKTQIINIEAEKKLIFLFKNSWENKKEEIYQKMKQSKKDVLEIVNKTFVELQQKLVEKIDQVQKRMGMQNSEKVIKMLQIYNIQLQKYQNVEKRLRTVKDPFIAKILYSEILPKSNELINQNTFDLSKLEVHDLDLLYNQNDLFDIKQKLLDLITVKISFPSVPQTRQQPLSVIPINQLQKPSIISVVPYKTGSFYYSKPKLACKSMVSSTVYCMNGNSQVLVQTKSNISVIEGKNNQTNHSNKHMLGNMRKSNIFPCRPLSQIR